MIPFIDLESQQKQIREELDLAISKVLNHGKYIMGPEVGELEERLAAYTGTKHCIAVSSGTDSLLIAMMALGIGPGDEVITVPYTWISTAETISLLGARPVFVDIEEDTWNMSPQLLEEAITENTKCIMPVGIYGQTANLKEINKIALKFGNIPVIEDAAQCFGATHHGTRSCALSTVGSTSFFPSKPLGCYGDGGALFTDDDNLAESMRQIRVHGQSKKHHHPVLGLNGRLDTIQAAILLTKLDIFDDEVVQRQKVAKIYNTHLKLSGRHSLPYIDDSNTSVYAQYTLVSEEKEDLSLKLRDKKIPFVSYYQVPLHLQPVFRYLNYKKGDFPVSENISSNGISLPMSPWLQAIDQQEVIEAINS